MVVKQPTIRLVAIDLDGTLLDSHKNLHPQTVEAIEQVKRRGIQVTLATGRTWGSTAPFAEQLGIDIPIITYNGACIVTRTERQVIEKTPMSMAAARDMLARLEQAGYYVKVYIDDHLYVQEATDETVEFSKKFGIPFTAVGRYNLTALTTDPLKVVVIERSDRIRKVWDLLGPWQTEFALTRDGAYGIEIVARSVNKGTALTKICHLLGIPLNQVMAIGNEGNDLEMLRSVGIGVAMGNAYDELKKHARMVTKTNDELGVAYALHKYILGEHFFGLSEEMKSC